ncbi:MAG: hypothetical protein R3D30_03460 [Hyphomicrobiales bacterium]
MIKKSIFGLFDEEAFRAEFSEAYADKGPDAALTYLIKRAPRMLRSSINRQEKLSHMLYMSRMIQNSGTTKHGIAKVARKANTVWRIWNKWRTTEPGTYIDFGAGMHDPIPVSAFVYGAGFSRAVANDQRKPKAPAYSALSLLESLAMLRLRPDKYIRSDIDLDSFFDRIGGFDLDRLAEGDFEAGIAPMRGRVDLEVCDIVNANIAEKEVTLITSHAVFEHVMDVDGVLEFLYSRTAPGGLGYHFVDLRDHRAYRPGDRYNEFSFLTEKVGPDRLNRLRQSELIDAFAKVGFEVLKSEPKQKPFPEAMRPRLIPRFANLTQDDLETVAVTLTVRRPA